MRHRRLCQGRYRRGAQARARLLRPAPCSKRPVCLKLVGGSPTTSSPSTPSVGPAAHAPPNASGAVLESRSRQPTFPRDPQQANTLDASRSPGASANGAGAQVVQSWLRSGYLARVWTTRPRLLPRVLRFRGSDCLGRSAMRPIRVDRSRSSSKMVYAESRARDSDPPLVNHEGHAFTFRDGKVSRFQISRHRRGGCRSPREVSPTQTSRPTQTRSPCGA